MDIQHTKCKAKRAKGVDALIFKINLFYNTASAVRVWNDLQALQVIVFYNIGEGCRYLITKRGVKSLLLEFVIDFAIARLSLRRLGNNKAGGIDATATLYCVFPARNLGYKQASLVSSA